MEEADDCGQIGGVAGLGSVLLGEVGCCCIPVSYSVFTSLIVPPRLPYLNYYRVSASPPLTFSERYAWWMGERERTYLCEGVERGEEADEWGMEVFEVLIKEVKEDDNKKCQQPMISVE